MSRCGTRKNAAGQPYSFRDTTMTRREFAAVYVGGLMMGAGVVLRFLLPGVWPLAALALMIASVFTPDILARAIPEKRDTQ